MTEFEKWAMRGLVLGLLGICWAFVWREITGKDAIWKTVTKNRESNEAAIAEARQEFTASLDRIAGQFRASIDAVNSTLSTLTGTIGRLDATMAKEYTSKADLKEAKEDIYSDLATVKEDLRADLENHAKNCPAKLR